MCSSKEDVGVQVSLDSNPVQRTARDQDQFMPERVDHDHEVDVYYTRRQSDRPSLANRSPGRAEGWQQSYRRFDSYHRNYDRNDYHDGYNY